MSKKKEKTKETTIENYYDLKVDKVNELVSALKDEDYPFEDEVNYNMNVNMGVDDPKNYTKFGKEKNFDPYKTDFLGRVPAWIKAIFIKFWFSGAVCYFIMWGLNIASSLDRAVLVGAVLGLVVELLVNPLFRFMESDKKEFNYYIMFPFTFKAYWTFFANIVYYVFIGFLVAMTCRLSFMRKTMQSIWSLFFRIY